MEFLRNKSSYLKQNLIHLGFHASLLKVCSILFLVNGWISNITILACRRHSGWREGSGDLSPKAFWTSLWRHECELRHSHVLVLCCMYLFLLRSFPLYPPPLPTHKVQMLAISWTSVTRLSGTPSILPKWHYAISGASRKCFLFIILRPFMSNYKWSGGYLRAAHRAVCDTVTWRRKWHVSELAEVLWAVVPTMYPVLSVISLFSALLCLEGGSCAGTCVLSLVVKTDKAHADHLDASV